MMRLAEKIIHQQQPTPVSCTATCVAMAVGLPVAELGVDLDRAFNFDKFGIWLAERGIWMRVGIFQNGYGERFMQDSVYLVGIRSQNKIGTDHAVLLDTRGEREIGEGFSERSHWRTYDPNKGIEGKGFVDWVDEHSALDFCELKQRDSRYVCVGSAP